MIETQPAAESSVFVAHPWLKPLAIGTVAAAGALILAPYVLPAIGIGTGAMASQSIAVMHSSAAGSGIAGALNSALAAVPGIGASLAQGGTFTAFTSGAVGIGGVLLGNHMQKQEDGSQKISYGKLIKTAALITSALIALPSLLTGLGVGMVYLAAALGNNALASSTAATLFKTIGTMGPASVGPNLAAGAFATLPHLATCGAAIMPTALSVGLSGNTPSETQSYEARTYPAPLPEQNRKYTDGSIAAKITTETPLMAGQPVQAKLTLTHRLSNRPVTTDELAVNYTKKIHMFVADQSLKDYHHIHPTPTSTPGEYAFTFTPHTPNTYNAWTDIKLLRDDQNHRLKTPMPCALERDVRAYVPNNSKAIKDGLNFDWKASERLRKDTPTIVEVTITDSAGHPVTDLQPVMGAYAHLVGFSADGKSLVHTHPMGLEPKGEAAGGPTMRFHVEPDFTGPAQFYLQVKRDGKDVYASFGQQISPPLLNTQRINSSHASHAGHARI